MLPSILSLHLKRFSNNGSKIQDIINIPNTLNLNQFVTKKMQGKLIRYELCSIISHIGQEINSGHYTTLRIYPNDIGISYDDEKVSEITTKNLSSSDAYLIFYKQIHDKQDITVNKISTDIIDETLNRNQELLKLIQFTHLQKQHLDEVTNLIREFNDIFYVEGDMLSTCELVKHDIPFYTDSKIPNIKNYRLPFAQRETIQKHVDKLLEQDIIEPSKSPYNSPLLLVPKKGTDKSGKPKLRLV